MDWENHLEKNENTRNEKNENTRKTQKSLLNILENK